MGRPKGTADLPNGLSKLMDPRNTEGRKKQRLPRYHPSTTEFDCNQKTVVDAVLDSYEIGTLNGVRGVHRWFLRDE